MPVVASTGPRPSTAAMPETEHVSLQTYLATHGLAPTDVLGAIGNIAGGRTRRQVEQALTAWLAARPKG